MAILTRLYLKFQDKDGGSISMIYPCADINTADSAIKELMQGIVKNGSIFENVPVVMESAKIVTAETKVINIK